MNVIKMSNQLTVVIHTHNEEINIESVIESAKLLSTQIIIIDSQSTDTTVDLAKKNKVEVFSFPQYSYVEPAREFGISKSKTDWILILDADERITKELAREILKQVQDDRFTHYKIPRKNIFGEFKWLKYGGWWPDSQTRLINKKHFTSWPSEIHSTPTIEGDMGYLHNPLIHYFHGDIESMVKKTIIFENIESELLFNAKKNVTSLTFFRKFLGELFRRLIMHLGFLDGQIGIIESVYQAYSKTVTYLYLYEKKISRTL